MKLRKIMCIMMLSIFINKNKAISYTTAQKKILGQFLGHIFLRCELAAITGILISPIFYNKNKLNLYIAARKTHNLFWDAAFRTYFMQSYLKFLH